MTRIFPHTADPRLRKDVRFLGFELGQILQNKAGEKTYENVEQLRQLTKAARKGDTQSLLTAQALLKDLNETELGEVIRANSVFFDLANLAEDRHRIRVLKSREYMRGLSPRKESIGAAIEELARDRSAEEISEILDRVELELVFTAHPTEAKRKSVRQTLKRLRNDLAVLETELLPRERNKVMSRIRTDMSCLWLTETLRPSKPTVIEEAKRCLFVAQPLWDSIPRLYRQMRRILKRQYPDQNIDLSKRMIHFGSWIGGDRDGNPFVTSETTREALYILRQQAIELHLQCCNTLTDILSISSQRIKINDTLTSAINNATQNWPEYAASIEHIHPQETHRHFLQLIRMRLQLAGQTQPTDTPSDWAYIDGTSLLEDLRILRQSLVDANLEELADETLLEWIDRTTCFGICFARLDIREDSELLRDAVKQLAAAMQLEIPKDEKSLQEFLVTPFDTEAARSIDIDALEDASQRTLQLYELLEKAYVCYGKESLGCSIVSMTQKPSDVLQLSWLAQVAAARTQQGDNPVPKAVLPAVPLFETIQDLQDADKTLTALLECRPYKESLASHGHIQDCMVGYSDSCKDGGVLASNWYLFTSQTALANVANKHNIGLRLFHGRGGSLGRGGGPAARGILCLPPESNQHGLRITEQGEVLAERYDDPDIANRHLEQVLWATAHKTASKDQAIPQLWIDSLDNAAAKSRAHYRAFRDDDAFLAYFDETTPINTIETLPIGSRPSRRRGQRQLQNLRAIPYTFAWVQSRQGLTAFYGLGHGFNDLLKNNLPLLQTMYKEWPQFKSIIQNTELALAKTDPAVTEWYIELAENKEAARKLWQRVMDEHNLTKELVLAITKQDELLSHTSWLKHSIEVRNPYVDALNLIQVELMRRKLPHDHELLRLSVQGIAAGLRTTG